MEIVKNILQNLKPHEGIYLIVLARRKYETKEEYIKTMSNTELKLTEIVLIEKDKNELEKIFKILKRKVKAYEIEPGVYEKGNSIFSEDAIAYYYSPNPRDIIKSTLKTIHSLSEEISSLLNNLTFGEVNPEEVNIEQLIRKLIKIETVNYSNIHKAISRVKYFLVDVDCNSEFVFEDVIKKLKECELVEFEYVLKTKNGFHILVKNRENKNERKELGKFLYSEFNDKFLKQFNDKYRKEDGKDVIEFKGKNFLTPVPGFKQGNFIPQIIEI